MQPLKFCKGFAEETLHQLVKIPILTPSWDLQTQGSMQ